MQYQKLQWYIILQRFLVSGGRGEVRLRTSGLLMIYGCNHCTVSCSAMVVDDDAYKSSVTDRKDSSSSSALKCQSPTFGSDTFSGARTVKNKLICDEP